MEIVKFTKEKAKEWNEFCLKSDDAWFWHTAYWIEYVFGLRPELKDRNFSFCVRSGNEMIAMVLLNLEIKKSEKNDTGEYSLFPAFRNDLSETKKHEICKIIFNEIDRLACENKVLRTRFRQAPLSLNFLNKKSLYNYLLEFGYCDISLHSRILDLKKTEDELRGELRRNHKRNIKKEKNIKISFYDAKNIDERIFESYKKMHQKAAGFKTRSDKSFELMHNWIKKGFGFLVGAELDGKFIGFEYYIVYKNNVYGASSANDADYADIPIRHKIEWEAILWMKKQGFSFYELGKQQYGNLIYDIPSKKELNITHFKKGFGGFAVPLFLAEKYYDKKYFLNIYKNRINKFADLISLI
ncbi:GNAT family N-acetyltransferase [Candidatus Parcubacteria bacterium]|nr:GNAT family N-acetyltransferase [Candidatus Parcubacteria bacterium]